MRFEQHKHFPFNWDCLFVQIFSLRSFIKYSNTISLRADHIKLQKELNQYSTDKRFVCVLQFHFVITNITNRNLFPYLLSIQNENYKYFQHCSLSFKPTSLFQFSSILLTPYCLLFFSKYLFE